MSILKKTILIVVTVSCLTGCDFTSKKIAKVELKGKTIQSYLGGNLKLFYTENSAGMLGLGNSLSDGMKYLVFVIFTSLILVVLFIYVIIKNEVNKWKLVSFILFLSGGFGNLLDRILNNGKVTDFILVEFSSLHTGIFNIADFYVTIGLIILIFSGFANRKDSSQNDLTADAPL